MTAIGKTGPNWPLVRTTPLTTTSRVTRSNPRRRSLPIGPRIPRPPIAPNMVGVRTHPAAGAAVENKIMDENEPYDGGGWAGDGSGTDDFEDFNQMEADDYADE